MKKIIILILFFISAFTFSQNSEFNEIKKADDGLFFMYYDSSAAKSTILEFSDFIVLIEAPVKNEGGGARNLIDHEEGGEKILRSLADYFPTKPLKYVLHSHWHPHSISTVNPFLRNNVTVVTTEGNYKIIRSFIDTANIPGFKEKIKFVADSLEISDGKNKLTAYRLLKSDYPAIPTEDYLYFYLHTHNMLHCACMYNKWEGEPVDGKEILTGRQEDLNRFLNLKMLKPGYLIRYNTEKHEANDMQPIAGLENVINNGIRSADISKRLMETSQTKLDDSMDAVIKEIAEKKIPASIINSTVYNLLRKKELKKANSFAVVQAMLNPSDPNSWDTLGETYFFLGDMEMAEHFEKQSKKISPDFSTGGMEVWQKDLDEHLKIWEALTN